MDQFFILFCFYFYNVRRCTGSSNLQINECTLMILSFLEYANAIVDIGWMSLYIQLRRYLRTMAKKLFWKVTTGMFVRTFHIILTVGVLCVIVFKDTGKQTASLRWSWKKKKTKQSNGSLHQIYIHHMNFWSKVLCLVSNLAKTHFCVTLRAS